MRYPAPPSTPTAARPSPFRAFLTPRITAFDASPACPPDEEQDNLSELSLSGNSGHCQLLLASVLRELSQAADSRWLTLIAPPRPVCQQWLRDNGLNRERIILLHSRHGQEALDLACRALDSACSHTVVSWLEDLDERARQLLHTAACLGRAQSLNIRLSH